MDEYFNFTGAYTTLCDYWVDQCVVKRSSDNAMTCLDLTTTNNSGTINLTVSYDRCDHTQAVSHKDLHYLECTNNYAG